MGFDFTHFKRSCVTMTHQIPDQSAICVCLLGFGSVRNACGLNNRLVRAHVINNAIKSVTEDLERSTEYLVQLW